MPTYDYECPAGHRFELFHSIKDDKPKKCPVCGKRARRVPSAGAGLLFKGSGFYITDYRSDSYQKKAKEESAGSSAPSGESSKSGGESKSGGDSKGGSDPKGGGASKSGGEAKGAASSGESKGAASGGDTPKRSKKGGASSS